VLQSGRVVQQPSLYTRILGYLAGYMSEKVYLRGCCCTLACNAIKAASKEHFEKYMLPAIRDKLLGDLTLESLALACSIFPHSPRVSDIVPDLPKSSVLSHSWKKIFGEHYVDELVAPLLLSAEQLPSLHVVWTDIWTIITSTSISPATFWNHVVEKGVVS
jgi:hypothetical protein